ncbi:hypothetical protein EFO70_05950 [Lacticaseibacillus rhamnosus]|nr:hypothetical protein [Lacticaseibacillus rhamnosus]MCT3181076.1 hypothetical protein [Lacticaseibacillus rhamnosus]
MTRSPAQKPAHKDLGRNDQTRVITPKAAYAPVSNRAGSRSHKKSAIRFCWIALFASYALGMIMA